MSSITPTPSSIGSDAGFSCSSNSFYTACKDRYVSPEEGYFMINITTRRFRFMYSKANGLAYLLDLRFVGEGLDTADRSELENI